MENTKKCPKCGRELPLECFGKNKSRKDGLQPYCKECNKQYYVDNAEYLKQYKKQWHAEHRDGHIEKMKQRYAEHRDERIEKMKQYNAEHAEYLKQYKKQYYATIEGYAYCIRYGNLRADREYGRCGKDEDPLPSLEYYIWALQQPDFYDGKQYHWSEMGLDRIYNDKPHTFANVVPCSTKNNNRRQKMSFESFCEVMKNEKEELELVLQ